MHYFANKVIPDILIGKMQLNPDDSNDDITKERALTICENVIRQEEDEQVSDLQTDSCRMNIKNPVQFQLVLEYFSVGALLYGFQDCPDDKR